MRKLILSLVVGLAMVGGVASGAQIGEIEVDMIIYDTGSNGELTGCHINPEWTTRNNIMTIPNVVPPFSPENIAVPSSVFPTPTLWELSTSPVDWDAYYSTGKCWVYSTTNNSGNWATNFVVNWRLPGQQVNEGHAGHWRVLCGEEVIGSGYFGPNNDTSSPPLRFRTTVALVHRVSGGTNEVYVHSYDDSYEND